MTGIYSSYQQSWQERAPLAVHRVETEAPHACLDAVVTQAGGRLAVVVLRDRQREVARETWTRDGDRIDVGAGSLFDRVEPVPGGLAATVASGALANPEPYRLLRGRPFCGWVEVPEGGPYDPAVGSDTAYRRAAGLRIHDQGGLAEVVGADGRPLTVELTQVVYGRTLGIFKLAVYDLPAAEVAHDSHAAAYVWAEPTARRLGLNLRDVVTGWTLDDAGLANSDDAAVPRSSASAETPPGIP